ncbi:MAG: zinc-ribbon domain-containing protein [Romboutsia sp.]|nr:zinc-ribbon domain-containing protein [Romboutsia sp.]
MEYNNIFCTKCGRKNNSENLFCSQCGNEFIRNK